MIDHFGINCADLDAAKAFYDAVLAPLGFSRQMDFGVAVGYGSPAAIPTSGSAPSTVSGRTGRRTSRSSPRAPSGCGPSTPRRSAHGAETLHEPRIWPEYHDHYYGAFVRDPDGNNVEAVCHTADPDD